MVPGTCPDGGVETSDYTVDICMNDVLACVNNGGLPNGLNDLFNYDLRNAIVNGMGLCSLQVERCISDVRKNCANVYRVSSDVWLDFNSRKVQPEYYSFVLRRTGLTPNQAENTCWLLDKNTYGASFNAVANSGRTTSEYDQTVGAYNSQMGDSLRKDNPMGMKVNDGNPGVDGQRGHYARWDAVTAQCLLRVAAYNKDTHIKNSWLFGALGDDKPAEAWVPTGDSFSCNKDMFGFSLLNKTSTTAVVGVGGGTLVGAGIGAIAGHGKREFNCKNEGQLKEFTNELDKVKNGRGILNMYLEKEKQIPVVGAIDDANCKNVVELYKKYAELKNLDKNNCTGSGFVYAVYMTEEAISTTPAVAATATTSAVAAITTTSEKIVGDASGVLEAGRAGFEAAAKLPGATRGSVWKAAIEASMNAVGKIPSADTDKSNQANAALAAVRAAADEHLNDTTRLDGCQRYHSLNRIIYVSDYVCKSPDNDCIGGDELDNQIAQLGGVLNKIEIIQGEKSNMLKSIAIGAGSGAAAGGLATAITAFVEKGNINCRVADGLNQVGFGKSHTIDSLKDYYVKWNLRLPDTVMPTAQVVDCTTWKNACATLKDLNQCASAQINYKPKDTAITMLIPSACLVSGSVCIENAPVAKSAGACDYK